MIFSRMLMGQWTDRRASNALDGGVPWYDTYRTRDGHFVAVGALEPQFYEALLQGLGLAGQLPDRQDAANWPEIRRRFDEVFAGRTRQEWAEHFAASDACVTPVLSLTEATTHPHMQARGTFMPWQDGQVPAAAPVFDGARPPATAPSRRSSMVEALENWPCRAGARPPTCP
jgi:alpha-methylacyl-CoA racemase